MVTKLFCLSIIAVCVSAQSPWRSSPLISRVPGLRPVGDSMALPEFLTMNMAYEDNTNQRKTCPEINTDCPRYCRKTDNQRCRICDCRAANEVREPGECREPSLACPQSCRIRDHNGCKICSCEDNTTESKVLGTVYKTCYSMIMCMLSCKEGYKLSDVTDSHGCQTCYCINKNRETNGKVLHLWPTDSTHGQSVSTPSTHGNNWESETGSSVSTPGMGKLGVWDSNNGVGSSSTGCSGPMCPGEGEGINPMNPGGYKGSAESASCSGPFCVSNMGGGGASMMGGGGASLMGGGGASLMGGGGTSSRGDGSSSSGCSGPFCISGFSGSGMGGSAGSGLMGGPGGVGAFSPFGLAASSDKATSGCSGPFCNMKTDYKEDNKTPDTS